MNEDDWRHLKPEPIKLSPAAYAKFVDAIENPKPPTEALKRLMRGTPARDGDEQ